MPNGGLGADIIKEIFEYALEQLNCSKDKILHIASSLRADVKGVVPLGWDMVFVNREKLIIDNKTQKPFFEIDSLSEVLNILDI